MMMHHHTKIVYKRFSSWGDIIQMNIHWHFEAFLWPWPRTQQSNPIDSQDYPAYVNVPSSQVQLQNDSDGILESHILIYDPSLWPWPWRQQTNHSEWLWLMMTHRHTTFGSLSFSGSENFVLTFNWHSKFCLVVTVILLSYQPCCDHFEVLLWPWPWTQQSNSFVRHSCLW